MNQTTLFASISCWLSMAAQGWTHDNTLNLITSLFGAAVGTVAGAWITQSLINRKQNYDAIVSELNSTNSAWTICTTIANRNIGWKKQHLKAIVENYNNDRARFEIFSIFILNNKRPPAPFAFNQDLLIFPDTRAPLDTLQTLIFERIAASRKTVLLASTLLGTLSDLQQQVQERRHLAREWEVKQPADTFEAACKYFGTANKEGVRDQKIQSNLNGIYALNEDTIYFSGLLTELLGDHSAALRKKLPWRYRRRIPLLLNPDWSRSYEAGLLPDATQYADWHKGFRKTPAARESLWRRIRGTKPQKYWFRPIDEN